MWVTLRWLVLILLGIVLGVWIRGTRAVTVPAAGRLSVESMQSLSQLVMLEVKLSDIVQDGLSGYLGTTQALLAVYGSFTIGTDLSQCRIEDQYDRRVTLVLADPQVHLPQVSLNESKVVALWSSGLWKVIPGTEADVHAINHALAQANQRLERESRDPRYLQQAKQQAQMVLKTFMVSLGYEVSIRWQSDLASKS